MKIKKMYFIDLYQFYIRVKNFIKFVAMKHC